ncbi:MAG: hypothetical protein DMG67_17440 [Acidobacteria bacterium]|nr:MAG: hypothetical protein DMG67_17440 [Acidobacteriota bacterium]
MSITDPGLIPNGKSVKLVIFKSFFRNGSQLTGTHNVSTDMTGWTSDNPNVISVSSRGLAIAHQSLGTATISATGWPGKVSILLTATNPTLQFITVTPFKSSLAVNGTQQYKAIGHYSDGSAPDLTNLVTWGVINNIGVTGGQASITPGPSGGLATGVTAGVVEITATYSGVTSGSYLNVGLTALNIAPTNPSVPKGEPQQFTATGTFGANDYDITNYVKWGSSNLLVANITGFPCGICTGGLASTLSQGTSNISASSGSIASNIQQLTVTPAVVTSVAISLSACNPASVPRGNSCQFTALAIYSDQTTATVTDSATWSSDAPSCAAVDATGLAATFSSVPNPCTAHITATFNSVASNSIALTVTPHVLTSITISPKNPTQPNGSSQQFTVKGHYTDGTFTIPNGANGPSWFSLNPSVAAIGSSSGLSNTVAPGQTTIGASYSGFQASTVFSVTAAVLNSITVTPLNPVPLNPANGSTTIPVAGTQDFQATGNYSDNTHPDISSIVTWNTSDSNVATINNPNSPGEASGVVAGTANITAALGSVTSAPSVLTVATINSITVSPSPVTLNPGGTQPFAATAHYAGATQDLTAFAPTWSSNPVSVATVDQSGTATAISTGTATITAQLGSVACTGPGCATLTVNQAVLQSITVSCDPHAPCTGSGEPVLQLGQTEQMIATGNYSDGSTQDLTQSVGLSWLSTNTAAATIVSNTGFLTTQGLGSTTIRATCTVQCPGAQSTIQGSLSLTVTF